MEMAKNLVTTISSQMPLSPEAHLAKQNLFMEHVYRNHKCEVQNILIDFPNEVDINKLDPDGMNSLHVCAALNYSELIQVLLYFGGHIDQKNISGYTPLHIASACGNMNIIKILLRKKANPFLLSRNGETAIDIARTTRIRDFILRKVRKKSITSQTYSTSLSSKSNSKEYLIDQFKDGESQSERNRKFSEKILVPPNNNVDNRRDKNHEKLSSKFLERKVEINKWRQHIDNLSSDEELSIKNFSIEDHKQTRDTNRPMRNENVRIETLIHNEIDSSNPVTQNIIQYVNNDDKTKFQGDNLNVQETFDSESGRHDNNTVTHETIDNQSEVQERYDKENERNDYHDKENTESEKNENDTKLNERQNSEKCLSVKAKEILNMISENDNCYHGNNGKENYELNEIIGSLKKLLHHEEIAQLEM